MIQEIIILFNNILKKVGWGGGVIDVFVVYNIDS